jgi:hypothetical protein
VKGYKSEHVAESDKSTHEAPVISLNSEIIWVSLFFWALVNVALMISFSSVLCHPLARGGHRWELMEEGLMSKSQGRLSIAA